jgi:hypothetical protein
LFLYSCNTNYKLPEFFIKERSLEEAKRKAEIILRKALLPEGHGVWIRHKVGSKVTVTFVTHDEKGRRIELAVMTMA